MIENIVRRQEGSGSQRLGRSARFALHSQALTIAHNRGLDNQETTKWLCALHQIEEQLRNNRVKPSKRSLLHRLIR